MAVNQFNYLDVGNLLVNELIGDPVIALLLGLSVIAVLCVVYNIEMQPMFGMGFAFTLGFLSYYYNSAVIMVVGLVVGFIIYGMISRYINS